MARKGLTALAVVLGIAATAVAPAAAEERKCTGPLGAVTVDNLKVPKGASCTLQGTKAKGTIKVGRGATLVATSIKVIGNVQAENHKRVSINGTSRIGGSIQIKQGGSASVRNARVKQDIQYDHNRKPLVVSGNKVTGNIQVVGNRAGATISGNVVNGNLDCKENRPAPTGGGNRVGGSKTDQCEPL
jgi:ABC-type molybdate transport system substrate-binding protein